MVNGMEIGVFSLSVGAPAAVAMLEELMACEAENVLEVGIAGGLQPRLQPGDIVVVTEALRDEGTSINHVYTSCKTVPCCHGASEKHRDGCLGISRPCQN